jgi:hypothetical protein
MKDYVGPSQRQHFIDRMMTIKPTDAIHPGFESREAPETPLPAGKW